MSAIIVRVGVIGCMGISVVGCDLGDIVAGLRAAPPQKEIEVVEVVKRVPQYVFIERDPDAPKPEHIVVIDRVKAAIDEGRAGWVGNRFVYVDQEAADFKQMPEHREELNFY